MTSAGGVMGGGGIGRCAPDPASLHFMPAMVIPIRWLAERNLINQFIRPGKCQLGVFEEIKYFSQQVKLRLSIFK
jgi:hypothetical protein